MGLIAIIAAIIIIGGGAYYFYFTRTHSPIVCPSWGCDGPLFSHDINQNTNPIVDNTETSAFDCGKYISPVEINNIFGYTGDTKIVSDVGNSICKWTTQRTAEAKTFSETGHFHIAQNGSDSLTKNLCEKFVKNPENINIGDVSCYGIDPADLPVVDFYKSGVSVGIFYDDSLDPLVFDGFSIRTKPLEKEMIALAQLIASRIQ